MTDRHTKPTTRQVAAKTAAVLLAGLLSNLTVAIPLHAQSPAPPAAARAKPGSPAHYAPNPLSPRAELYYRLLWGVNDLKVKSAESDELIRFSYRIVDPERAEQLNDVKNEPSLIDPKAGVKLTVPSLEKVGKLRQKGTPQAGKVYWMVFSNRGRRVKRGDRVNVVIGKFQAAGLVVE